VHSDFVHYTTGLGPPASFAAAVLLCAITATMCTIVLLRTGAGGTDAPRSAYRTITFAIVANVVVLGAVAAAYASGRSLITSAVGAVGISVSLLALAAGLLIVPAIVPAAARWGRLFDGLLVTACIAFIAWSLYVERFYDGPPNVDNLLALDAERWLLVAAIVVVAAVTCIAGVGATYPAGAAVPARAVCVGVALVGLGSGALLVIATTGVDAAWVGAVTLVAGHVMLAIGARGAEPRPAPPWLPEAREAGISTIAVAIALGACIARLTVEGPMDKVAIYIAVAIAGLLAAQQRLARRHINQYANQLAESERHFRSMAHTDALTGLANRRELMRLLQDESPGPCALLLIDLDGFKKVNDTLGHSAGDAVLAEVARRLKSNVRPRDCAARLGGDEFAILMQARMNEATAAAERILDLIKQPYESPEGTAFVSASIGLAGSADPDRIAALLHDADLALRFAKQCGKNRVEAYDEAYDDRVRRRAALEHELRGAVERNEMMLVYQPVVSLSDARVAGVEALLRWHHPSLGTVPPAEFIPLAEEAGLIHELGEFVVHEAGHQMSRWRGDGHEVWMSINASVRELHTPEYAHNLAEMLRRHRLPADGLVVEVTEHAAALDGDRLVERLSALRAGGVKIALDDFGAGYSSLNLLRTLPVDTLKIDRALLGGAGDKPLVDVVVALGRRLGLDVVAEGVSTAEQRDLLISCGCGYAQGEFFGNAMPAERVEALFGPSLSLDSDQPVAPRDAAADLR
jgi:diguanylate cyclase